MRNEIKLITPESDPDHYVVGKKFRFFGVVFICDSWVPEGYWMTPVDTTVADPIYRNKRVHRRNVSERAIGRTFHRIYDKE